MDREEIIDKHKCLLDKMKEDRIFSICFENNAVYLNEQCDDYFSHQLTKEDCLLLMEKWDRKYMRLPLRKIRARLSGWNQKEW